MRVLLIVLFFASTTIYGQLPSTESPVVTNLHNGLTERVGNFSIELLYHTSKLHDKGLNLIMSPITVWTVLAVISEGATGHTASQINHALRISPKHRNATRVGFQSIYEWLQVNTSTVELAKVNAIFMDQTKLVQSDFISLAESIYKTKALAMDFKDGEKTANTINEAISKVTHGRIPKLVTSNDFSETPMILTSALYFKGQWTIPFNASSTTKMPFYNSTGQKIGDVNMMYNRFTYPFSNIKELQARVIELPYGKENRLSMLIMLPNPGVSLEQMFFNFGSVPLDTVFKELRVSKEEYGDDEVDCFLPRFKIESNLDLTNVLSNSMGIVDLFDQRNARLPNLARTPVYVSKVIHKAEIEVTEEGTVGSAVTAAEFSNRIGIVSFVANRPFCYLIVEKVTNSIVFGGFYVTPSVY
ncbi:serpin (serine protease inhibitor) domain-containing protein [Phthorimaea operculella]|nr:serpin (serine protease inhibitor) domain-containing protein [Phthorimaea operculella]